MKETLRDRLRNPRTRLATLRDLIETEKLKGNRIAEAAYRIRFVRFTGFDAFGDLIEACNLVSQGGMDGAAAFIAELIVSGKFNCPPSSTQSAARMLSDRHEAPSEEVSYSVLNDTRKKTKYRMSCIASLYNEENLIEKSFRRLIRQTLYKRGELELIFVDSNSPQGESAIFEKLLREFDHVLYLKTNRTERLSKAWNRGLLESTGDFVTFTAPSNFFVDDAFERLLGPFETDPEIVLVQGDVAKPFDYYPDPSVPLASRDLQRLTNRRTGRHDQLHPFFFGNYLAFDSGVFRRTALERSELFDESMICAAENKFLLNLLGAGKLYQLGEVVESSYEQGGERLTVHPRVEIEHFMAMHQLFTEDNLIQAAKRERAPDGVSDIEALRGALTLSLGYVDPYNVSFPKPSMYNLDQALTIAKIVARRDPESFSSWNTLIALSIRNLIAHSMQALYFARSKREVNKFKYIVNRIILKATRAITQFMLLTQSPTVFREQNRSVARLVLVRKALNIAKSLFNRSKTFSTDIFWDTIW